MGYRSEVIFGVIKKHKEKLEEVLEKHNLLKYFDNMERDNCNIYVGDCLKWYSEFEEVKEITNFIDDVYYQNKDDSFMVCMGEDGEIHNEIGEYWNYVDIIKTIKVIV